MDYALSLLGPLGQGALVTLKLFVITLVLAVPLGLVLALARLSRLKPLSAGVNGYIWLMRGTPLMLQMLFIYFALPFVPVVGVRLPDFPAAVTAFALNYAAYFAEIFRAGIQAVDRGQGEAARSLGLGRRAAFRLVVLPQAVRNVLPALGNELVVVIKESSIVSVIGIAELMYKADTVRGVTFKPFEPLLVAALLYFLMTYPLSRGLSRLERRLRDGAY